MSAAPKLTRLDASKRAPATRSKALNIAFGAFTPNAGTEVAPLVGFNYIHLQNRMQIRGVDDTSSTNHSIDSKANNNIFGPEIGLRMETRSKWLTLGFEPKFTFGINRISDRLTTHQIFTPTELDFGEKRTRTRFSPVIDLGTYARIRLAEHINLTLGYQFMATTAVSFSQDNVTWNSSSDVTAPPLIRLAQNKSDFFAHGANVGLQWQF